MKKGQPLARTQADSSEKRPRQRLPRRDAVTGRGRKRQVLGEKTRRGNESRGLSMHVCVYMYVADGLSGTRADHSADCVYARLD